MSEPKYQIKTDVQHVRRQWHAYCHAADTPILQVWLYENGKQWTPPTDWTATIGFGEDFEDSTSLVTVAGTLGSGTPDNYVEFDFSSADVATSGDFFCQILLRNAAGTEQYVFGDGTLHILKSPISGAYTPAVLTSVINWGVITSTGTTPWPDQTAVIEVDCADTPISIDSDDAGKTWLVPSTCSQDVVLILPDASSTTTIGSVFKFVNQSGYKLTVQAQDDDHIDELIDGNAIYSGSGGVNDNPPYASIRIKQLQANDYHAIHGRLKWTYTNG